MTSPSTSLEMYHHYAEHIGEVSLPIHVLETIPHSGRADAAVAEGVQDVDVKAALVKIPDDKLRSNLKETGAWEDADLLDRDLNEQRFLWIAAGDYHEERHSS